MEKTTTLNLRVNPTVKGRAEEVLSRLGIPAGNVQNAKNAFAKFRKSH